MPANKQRLAHGPEPVDVAVALRSADELTDAQLERLIDLGRRESELIDELHDAVRTGDRMLAWRISVALFEASRKGRGDV